MSKQSGKHVSKSGASAQPADHDLLVRIIERKDRDAYDFLVQRYTGKIWRLALSILRNEQEAEDAVQDVFLTLWQSLEKWDLNGTAQFSTWIYRVSFNKCIDIKRKYKPSSDMADHTDLKAPGKTAYQDVLQVELTQKVGELLKTLPDTQRMALSLYYYEELSVEQISSRLDKTEQSVRSLLKRGRATLREKMQYDQSFHSLDVSSLAEHLWR